MDVGMRYMLPGSDCSVSEVRKVGEDGVVHTTGSHQYQGPRLYRPVQRTEETPSVSPRRLLWCGLHVLEEN